MRKTLEEISVNGGVYGGGFSAIELNGNAPRYVRITDITNDGKLTKDAKGASGKPIEWEKYKLKEGDLLFARSGATVGKTFLYDKTYGECIFAGYLIRFRLKIDIACPKYVYYFTKSPKYHSWVSNKQNVVAQPNINAKQYGQELQIPLPPLEEQKRIAAILDSADDYRQKTRALIDKYDELAQSLFLEMFGDPVTNPKGWEVKTLKEITLKIGSGATPRGGKDSYKKTGISLIRSLNVFDNLFKRKALAYIDDTQAEKLSNVIVEKGDVLFNITGASVCRCCIVPEEILPARVNQHVSILRPDQKFINSSFLMFCLTSKNMKNRLIGIGTQGGATREAITKSELESLKIIVPNKAGQDKFYKQIKNIREQKKIADQNLKKSDQLFNSLLQAAFKGEL